jgi:hypothetical protein
MRPAVSSPREGASFQVGRALDFASPLRGFRLDRTLRMPHTINFQQSGELSRARCKHPKCSSSPKAADTGAAEPAFLLLNPALDRGGQRPSARARGSAGPLSPGGRVAIGSRWLISKYCRPCLRYLGNQGYCNANYDPECCRQGRWHAR